MQMWETLTSPYNHPADQGPPASHVHQKKNHWPHWLEVNFAYIFYLATFEK